MNSLWRAKNEKLSVYQIELIQTRYCRPIIFTPKKKKLI